MSLPRKVLIYATSTKGLLVFEEPDFPEVSLQVPGGTVEPGEDIELATAREFHEETGLAPNQPFLLLGTTDYSFIRADARHTHRRSYFHVTLPETLPDVWHHREDKPDGGGPSILFRFFWLDVNVARSRLGFGMGEVLDRIEG